MQKRFKLISLAHTQFLILFMFFSETSFTHGDHDMAIKPTASKKANKRKVTFTLGIDYADKSSVTGQENSKSMEMAEHKENTQPTNTQNGNSNHQHSMNMSADTANGSTSSTAPSHSHDHSLAHGFGLDSTKLSLKTAYQFASNADLLVVLASTKMDGFQDPSLILGYNSQLSSRSIWRTTFGAMAPLSKESKELSKTSSLSLGTGLLLSRNRWTFVSSVTGTLSSYAAKTNSGQSMDGHGMAESKIGVVSRSVLAAPMADATPTAMNHEEHDKEKIRYTIANSATYFLSKKVSVGTGIDLSRTQWEMDDPTWLASLNLLQFRYNYYNASMGVGIGFQSEDHSIIPPTTGVVRIGYQLTY